MTDLCRAPDNIRIQVKVPPEVQLKLKKLIETHQHGIWGSELLEKYEKTFHEVINYKTYGYGSVENMCCKMNYIFSIVKGPNGSFKLYSATANVPATVSLSDTDLNIPAGLMQHGETIKRQELPALNSPIQVRVSDYYDVSKFWFYKDSIQSTISNLTTKLNLFYSATGDFYRIPLHQLAKGLYCAAKYQNDLYRAIIVNELPQLLDVVKVYYIDFGTVDLVSVKEIHYLHESFKEPSAAAMRGRLGLIQPPGLNMPWDDAATALFVKFIKAGAVTAHFESVQKEDSIPIYTLRLSIQQEGSTVWIHKELMEQKLAIGIDDPQDQKQSVFQFVNNTQKMHLVPLFRDLEVSASPTFSEVSLMRRALGFSMARILKKYIKVEPQALTRRVFRSNAS